MKKSTIAFLIALLAVSVVSTSCEKLDATSSLLVGKWEATSPLPILPLGPVTDNQESAFYIAEPFLNTWTFQKNGTGKIKFFDPCTWKISGNILHISQEIHRYGDVGYYVSDGEPQFEFQIIEITSTTLILNYVRPDGIDSFMNLRISFIRK